MSSRQRINLQKNESDRADDNGRGDCFAVCQFHNRPLNILAPRGTSIVRQFGNQLFFSVFDLHFFQCRATLKKQGKQRTKQCAEHCVH